MPDTTPADPPVLVDITRYEVSVLPRHDVNFNAYVLHVQRRRDGWGITDGFGWLEGPNGHWTLDHYEAMSFADQYDAIAMAKKLAPGVVCNGVTATEAYRRTHPAR